MADRRRVALDEIVVHFQELEDPRSRINQRHPLARVLVIAPLAVLAGAGGPTAIARRAALPPGGPEGRSPAARARLAQRGAAQGCLPPRPDGAEAGGLSGVLRQVGDVAA